MKVNLDRIDKLRLKKTESTLVTWGFRHGLLSTSIVYAQFSASTQLRRGLAVALSVIASYAAFNDTLIGGSIPVE